jgi:FG-GAP repeat
MQVARPVPDFNNDGFGDLAVGAPGETVRGRAGAGAVSVLYGGASGGLGVGDTQLFYQGFRAWAEPGSEATRSAAGCRRVLRFPFPGRPTGRASGSIWRPPPPDRGD